MINYLKFKLLLVLILFSFNDIKSQSVFQTWPTIDLQGEIFDDLEIKLEYRNKYDNSSKESKQGRIDLGVAYKLKKIKIGIYYREIYDLKKDGRVSEIRPHLNITYKLNDNMKIRLRNEYRINEVNDNVFRYRLRYSYSLKLFDNYNPFVQNEIFLSENRFVRNRINLGLNIKFKETPFVFKPSYILESNRKVSGENITWSQKNVFVLALSIKI
ncbi:MAG: DUF2490 domain-containing protein [Bacteroidota bacterium]|nr:DUF2490 domain-containing protein [Bacteroidota bacterium]